MAEHTETVTIKPTENPNNPTIEESYQQLIEEGYVDNDSGEITTEPNVSDNTGDTPSSLEKFRDPKTGQIDYAKLEKSYLELEKMKARPKQSEDDDDYYPDDSNDDYDEYPEPTEEDREFADEVTREAGLDLQEVSDEWATNGDLSEDTYSALEDAGYPREAVETYINGLVSGNMALANEAYGVVGGAAEYDAMIDWAIDNLSDDEHGAFDSAVNSGNKAMVLQAVRGLNARYASANDDGTREPASTESGRAAVSKNSYKHLDEYMADLNDPRYETSEGYRNQVMIKLGNSGELM